MGTKWRLTYVYLFLALILVVVLLLQTRVANAGNGILACEGRHNNSPSSEQFQTVGIALSNFNDNTSIRIDRIVVYSFTDGEIICDSNSGDTPAMYDIKPNGGKYFGLPGTCPGFLEQQHFNMKIYWSSSGNKNPLHGIATTRTWDRVEPFYEVGRSVHECVSVK